MSFDQRISERYPIAWDTTYNPSIGFPGCPEWCEGRADSLGSDYSSEKQKPLPPASRKATRKSTYQEFLDLADEFGVRECPRCRNEIFLEEDPDLSKEEREPLKNGEGRRGPPKGWQPQKLTDMLSKCPYCKVDYPNGKWNGTWPPTNRNPKHPVEADEAIARGGA